MQIADPTIDYQDMLIAANDWGPENDPERRWFLAGWRDYADQCPGTNCPTSEDGDGHFNAPWCAYNSGIITAREYQTKQQAIITKNRLH